MFDWLKKSTPCKSAVLFRGTLPPRAEDFVPLRKQGITLKRFPENPERHWGLKLLHPTWGETDLFCPRGFKPPPEQYALYDAGLTIKEKQDITSAGTGVLLRLKATGQHLLRDRKHLLRFSRAIMGADGLATYDLESSRFWSPRSLDDELAHDADLDVEGIYCVHVVTEDSDSKSAFWLHTHGLDHAGGFDFDIINPASELCGRGNDLLRAMAFAILEKNASADERCYSLAHPGGDIRLVPAAEFRRRVQPRDVVDEQILNDEHHLENHSVLCEPARGLLARWSKRVAPAKFVMQEMPDGTVLRFSHAATTLMGERARGTYSVFRGLVEEFAELELPNLVKLGYPTDNGADGGREHLWFQVHAASDADVEATLLNQPLHVSKVKEGDRGRHPVELLSDWTILTPLGSMTPRSSLIGVILREKMKERSQA